MYWLFISILTRCAQKYSNSSTSLTKLWSGKWLFPIGCCCLPTTTISIYHHPIIISIPSFKSQLMLLLKLFRSTIQVKLANHSNIRSPSLISIISALNFHQLNFIRCSHNHNWPLISFQLICLNYAKKYQGVSFKKERSTASLTFINTYLTLVHLSPLRASLFYQIFLILRRCHFYWAINLCLNLFWKRNASKTDWYMSDGW